MRYQWNPWHGCKKCSPGCLNCYVYYLDGLRGVDASKITKSKTNFDYPLKKNRNGEYKIPSGVTVATCFTSDFFLKDADEWRMEAWKIIKERSDVFFLIPTKRIDRFLACIPEDWGEGYPNVILAVTMENTLKMNERMPIFLKIKAQRKVVFASPLLESIDFSPFLKSKQIESISVGGESYPNARVCDFSWVEQIKKTCDENGVKFDFHQTGSNFIKDGKQYKIKHYEEYNQAKKALQYLERKKK